MEQMSMSTGLWLSCYIPFNNLSNFSMDILCMKHTAIAWSEPMTKKKCEPIDYQVIQLTIGYCLMVLILYL